MKPLVQTVDHLLQNWKDGTPVATDLNPSSTSQMDTVFDFGVAMTELVKVYCRGKWGVDIAQVAIVTAMDSDLDRPSGTKLDTVNRVVLTKTERGYKATVLCGCSIEEPK